VVVGADHGPSGSRSVSAVSVCQERGTPEIDVPERVR
jgi:hypothetical protein